MTAAQKDSYEEEYEEYDEFDDEDEERGLSGLVVLLMGVVMLGAFASIVWIAYHQGMKAGSREAGGAPYVAADPEPLKIENPERPLLAENRREIYDKIGGAEGETVEVLASQREEPIAREGETAFSPAGNDPFGADEPIGESEEDGIAALAARNGALSEEPAVPAPANAAPETRAATPPTPARAETQTSASAVGALAGTHLVQVGAFGSEDEAMVQWSRLQGRLGDYLDGKAPDVERADLGERGVFYRLRVGPFASADSAASYCEGLKQRGQDCLVRAK
ncbi:SPOR domain-containing protein [Amphiplicatus metriothermophilus]|uniref:Sporulation related domain-containing protein n=1 Tax=Amphiplicatus metriothermophilus TaxID=1519374 RepID=A0A239PU48_9PROT|nr:SPOR domain-containing protein [Amphiplicatus metriothermophilus]MBB5519477.1 cell division septation protein DedD [Amphiplicatus metriothermophilus]SNT73700.1 Sporulation related domain-containing protein [Amphiplicatus metriothermophilus]